jgi:hypothetical protein
MKACEKLNAGGRAFPMLTNTLPIETGTPLSIATFLPLAIKPPLIHVPF